jgi:hypothetical protein
MTEASGRKPPKGGRKGGTQYPRVNLEQAVEYARKLASKTHTGPQPAAVILPGVFGSARTRGQIRASALKQYSLLQGKPEAYEATALAKRINSAPSEDLPPLLREACLSPKLFSTLYKTFQGDLVSNAKIRQQALQLEVHPDSADECVRIFVESSTFAGLAQLEADGVRFASTTADPSTQVGSQSEPPAEVVEEPPETPAGATEPDAEAEPEVIPPVQSNPRRPGPQVSINIDPSMDPEKLEKLLKVLKQYGAL